MLEILKNLGLLVSCMGLGGVIGFIVSFLIAMNDMDSGFVYLAYGVFIGVVIGAFGYVLLPDMP